MWETFAKSFTTFFAVVGPVDVAVLYTALTAGVDPATRNSMALRGVLIATGILFAFALFGDFLLSSLGISLAALRAAGGVLLLLIGIDMVFARSSGGTSTTSDEAAEASTRHDLSVFPLATPLIAGPGAMGAAVLLVADVEGDYLREGVVLGALLVVLLLTWLLLLIGAQVHRLLGVTGMHVISRVFGVLLSALAVQFLFDGIQASGLLN